MIATRTLGRIAAAWAASYLPIHVYWALGGTTTWLGIDGAQDGFRAANWAACVVIAGAGLTGLALTSAWGRQLPTALRRGTAWVGGAFGLLHWATFTAASTLRLAGVVGYPSGGDPSAEQLRRFDWANLGYFELWFGVMGLLLLACARRDKALDTVRRPLRATGTDRVSTGLVLAGIATVIWGVFTFSPWIFAGAGPALVGIGALTAMTQRREGSLR
jgi:hypothetical protein